MTKKLLSGECTERPACVISPFRSEWFPRELDTGKAKKKCTSGTSGVFFSPGETEPSAKLMLYISSEWFTQRRTDSCSLHSFVHYKL
uniref:Uncharacterized protein n=1 Tax=Fundulus heteroclitus TaxID=8078 RepID=A0A3Q2PVU3_FUNHE